MRRSRIAAADIDAIRDNGEDDDMQLGDVIDKLYESEINCLVATFWDAGYRVQLGDDIGGFVAETYVKTSAEAAAWLDNEVRKHYPKSVYAGGKGYSTEANGYQ